MTTAPPAATMTVQSGTLARVVAGNTSVNLVAAAQAANFTPVGTVYASASDAAGVLQAPVQVTAGANGLYTFSLDTATGVTPGRYKGNATIKLCTDQACTTAQSVASISVPYDITILNSDTSWPGDNLTALAAMSGAGDWSAYQGNNAHTGYVPVAVKADQIALRWKRGLLNNPSSSNNPSLTPQVTANGLLYTTDSNTLYAYNETDGSRAWKYDFGTNNYYNAVGAPAVANGAVYVGGGLNGSNYLVAFDAATGAVRYRASVASSSDRLASPVIQDGVTYYNSTSSYNGLYAFSATGETLFNTGNSAQTPLGTPAVDANGVYLNTGNGILVFKPKTGERLAAILDSDSNAYSQGGSTPVIGATGIYTTSSSYNYSTNLTSNSLTRFDVVKRYIDWRVAGSYRISPAYASGVLYALNGNPFRVEARAEADGALQWSWTPQLSAESSFYGPAVVTKNLLFVSTDRVTYAIDLTTHKSVWSYPMAGQLSISQNGVLYIQNAGVTVAVNLQ
ncbi:PQQ-binding-like beta-propeller repeat protein [Duganella sp. Leaf126]|uniref:outer membrane protein assembly factor BamB family protein n=1 Tax=Duganella sp. Leaf126 TaxID=1736266 RepID=UPI001E43D2D0|nr:PQQ-binding-like beta-propeller repeat protein [Duganella sp. Leaf126]